jgi:hypothetical protein
MAPGEQLLAGPIPADAEIEHFNSPPQALANPTTSRGLQAILQLPLPGDGIVHLEGLAEGIPQHRNAKGSWRWRPRRQFGMAKSRLVDAHPTAPLPGPPALGPGPKAVAPGGVHPIEGRICHAHEPQADFRHHEGKTEAQGTGEHGHKQAGSSHQGRGPDKGPADGRSARPRPNGPTSKRPNNRSREVTKSCRSSNKEWLRR